MAKQSVAKTNASKTTATRPSRAATRAAPTTAVSKRGGSRQRPIDARKTEEYERKKKEAAAKRAAKAAEKKKLAKAAEGPSRNTRTSRRSTPASSRVTNGARADKPNPSRMMEGLIGAGRRISNANQEPDRVDADQERSEPSAETSRRNRAETDKLVAPVQESRRGMRMANSNVNEDPTQSSSSTPPEGSSRGVAVANNIRKESTRKRGRGKRAEDRVEMIVPSRGETENDARDERHKRRNAKQRNEEEATARDEAGSDEEGPQVKRSHRIGKREVFDIQYPAGWVQTKTKKEYTGTMKLVEVFQY